MCNANNKYIVFIIKYIVFIIEYIVFIIKYIVFIIKYKLSKPFGIKGKAAINLNILLE